MLHFRHSMHYRAQPLEVAQLYADPEYFHSRTGSNNDAHLKVTVKGNAQDGFSMSVTSTEIADRVPEQFRRVLTSAGSATFIHRWVPEAGGGYRGTVEVQASGLPVALDGSFVLSPVADGARMNVEGTLKVSIPFLGSRMEKKVEPKIAPAFAQEEEAANKALAERGATSAAS